MSIFNFFRKNTPPTTASIAKERLQIIVQHQRGNQDTTDFMPKLQKELIEVISRYVNIDPSQVVVALERNDQRSVLELNITMPDAV